MVLTDLKIMFQLANAIQWVGEMIMIMIITKQIFHEILYFDTIYNNNNFYIKI